MPPTLRPDRTRVTHALSALSEPWRDPDALAAIVDAYDTGWSFQSIAEVLGCSATTVRHRVLAGGGAPRPSRLPNHHHDHTDAATTRTVTETLQSSRSVNRTKPRVAMSWDSVAGHRDRAGLDARTSGGQRANLDDDAIEAAYRDGQTATHIAGEAGVSVDTVLSRLRDRDIEVRTRPGDRIDPDELTRLVTDGLDDTAIAERLDVTAGVVAHQRHQAGLHRPRATPLVPLDQLLALAGDGLDAAGAASTLGISPRTLHRMLDRHGARWRDLRP